MILRRVLSALMAAAAFSAAAAMAVFAAGFAFYALVEPYLGRAGAAAAVIFVMAAIMAIAGLVMAGVGRRKPEKVAAQTAGSIIERAVAFLQKRPVLSASAAIAAGLMVAQNPKYLGAVLRSFVEDRPPPSK